MIKIIYKKVQRTTWIKEWVVLTCLAIMITLICLPLLMNGPLSGDSFTLNLSWMKGFADVLADGIFYPRWLPDMNREAGSPVFFFYAPVPFFLTSLCRFLLPNSDLFHHLGIGLWVVILLSGVAFYTFARQQVNRLPAMASAFLYAILPYHFAYDILHRQAIGESTVYIFMPLALLMVRRLSDGWHWVAGLALTYALTIGSHLPGTLLFSPFLLLYAVLVYRDIDRRRFLLQLTIGIALGIALSGIYLIPALTMQKYINVQGWWNEIYKYDKWFVFGSDNPFSLGLIVELRSILLQTTTLAGLLFLTSGENKHHQIPWLLFIIGSWFLMTPFSIWLWELIPLLQKVQFPYRTMIVTDLAVALISMQALAEVSRIYPKRSLAVLGIFATLCLVSIISIADKYQYSLQLSEKISYQEMINEDLDAGWEAHEYYPKTVKNYPEFGPISNPRVCIIGNQGVVHIEKWGSRHIILQMDLPETTKIIVHQFYFPGWQARIDATGHNLTVTPSTREGLLQLHAPKGHYRLHLTLETLPEEQVGAIMSLIALIFMLLLYAVGVYPPYLLGRPRFSTGLEDRNS